MLSWSSSFVVVLLSWSFFEKPPASTGPAQILYVRCCQARIFNDWYPCPSSDNNRLWVWIVLVTGVAVNSQPHATRRRAMAALFVACLLPIIALLCAFVESIPLCNLSPCKSLSRLSRVSRWFEWKGRKFSAEVEGERRVVALGWSRPRGPSSSL